RQSVELPFGAEDGVPFADALFVDSQAVAIALRVAELQQIGRPDIGRELLVLAVVEQHLEPLARRDAKVIAALRADREVLFHFLPVNDLFALIALEPQPLGDCGLVDGLERLLFFAEPRHARDSTHSSQPWQPRASSAA